MPSRGLIRVIHVIRVIRHSQRYTFAPVLFCAKVRAMYVLYTRAYHAVLHVV